MQLRDRAYIELNPDDALRYGIYDGEDVETRSRRGMAVAVAKITDTVAQGTAFVPFHFSDSPINFVTNDAFPKKAITLKTAIFTAA